MMDKETNDKLVKVKNNINNDSNKNSNNFINKKTNTYVNNSNRQYTVPTEKQKWVELRLSYLDSLSAIDRERDDVYAGDSIQKLIEKLNTELVER